MLLEHVPVEWTRYSRVPNLNGIAEILWKLREKGIKISHKVLAEHTVALKLKQEWPGMRPKLVQAPDPGLPLAADGRWNRCQPFRKSGSQL